MSLPKLLEPAEVAAYLGVSEDTLARWRSTSEGPVAVRVGQRVCYTEHAVAAYITAQETGSKAATPAAMQAAMMEGSAARRAANAERNAAMKQMDADDRIPDSEKVVDGVTPLTMSNVGASGNFEKHSTIPGMQTFGQLSGVAMAPAQNGRVPMLNN